MAYYGEYKPKTDRRWGYNDGVPNGKRKAKGPQEYEPKNNRKETSTEYSNGLSKEKYDRIETPDGKVSYKLKSDYVQKKITESLINPIAEKLVSEILEELKSHLPEGLFDNFTKKKSSNKKNNKKSDSNKKSSKQSKKNEKSSNIDDKNYRVKTKSGGYMYDFGEKQTNTDTRPSSSPKKKHIPKGEKARVRKYIDSKTYTYEIDNKRNMYDFSNKSSSNNDLVSNYRVKTKDGNYMYDFSKKKKKK